MSRLGDNYQNWAIFERPDQWPSQIQRFGPFVATIQAFTRRWRR
jgi:hypothetical protein